MQVGVACYAMNLQLISEALELLGQAGTKLAAVEGERFRDLAGKVEELRLEVLRAVREALPPEGDT